MLGLGMEWLQTPTLRMGDNAGTRLREDPVIMLWTGEPLNLVPGSLFWVIPASGPTAHLFSVVEPSGPDDPAWSKLSFVGGEPWDGPDEFMGWCWCHTCMFRFKLSISEVKSLPSFYKADVPVGRRLRGKCYSQVPPRCVLEFYPVMVSKGRDPLTVLQVSPGKGGFFHTITKHNPRFSFERVL
jgi:hypothetical protein